MRNGVMIPTNPESRSQNHPRLIKKNIKKTVNVIAKRIFLIGKKFLFK